MTPGPAFLPALFQTVPVDCSLSVFSLFFKTALAFLSNILFSPLFPLAVSASNIIQAHIQHCRRKGTSAFAEWL